MKGIVVYKSNYGSTRQYAEWLAEELGVPAVPVGAADPATLAAQELVIVGCPVFAFRPQLAGWLRKNRGVLAGKRLVLFTTSGAPADEPRLRAGFEQSLPAELRAQLRWFPLGGRMVFAELRPLHRFFMRLGRRMEKDPGMKRRMMEDVDRVDRGSLGPLLEHARGEAAGSRP